MCGSIVIKKLSLFDDFRCSRLLHLGYIRSELKGTFAINRHLLLEREGAHSGSRECCEAKNDDVDLQIEWKGREGK